MAGGREVDAELPFDYVRRQAFRVRRVGNESETGLAYRDLDAFDVPRGERLGADDFGDGVDGGVAVSAAWVRLHRSVHHLEVAAEAFERA